MNVSVVCKKKAGYSNLSGYKSGCRCDLCKLAGATYSKSKQTEIKKYNAKYKKSVIGKLRTAKYEQSEKAKSSRKTYHASPAAKIIRATYNQSAAGKASAGLSRVKRRIRYYHSMLELTEHDRKLIYVIYLLRPIGYEVDHIKPLSKGGLDIPTNLQYLSILDNRRKHAKLNYIPTDRVIQWNELIDPLTGEAR